MSDPYVGEIRMFGGNFAPAGWAYCNGQLLAISENDTLFNLIGTTYGGDGQETFGLPDLRGRVPVHQGSGISIGQLGGVESVTLTSSQLGGHGHAFSAGTDLATGLSPSGSVYGKQPPAGTVSSYIEDAPNQNMAPNAIGPTGQNQPHSNMQPFLCISFIISLFGIFPSQT